MRIQNHPHTHSSPEDAWFVSRRMSGLGRDLPVTLQDVFYRDGTASRDKTNNRVALCASRGGKDNSIEDAEGT